MGLISSIVGGALQGGGEAGVKVGLNEQEALIQEARDQRLQEAAKELEGVRQRGAENLQGKAFTHAENLQGKSFEHAENLQQGNFAHSEALQQVQQDWQSEQNSQQRDLTREQIQASKDIAASNHAVSLQIAKLGGTVQQDKNGNIIYLDKEGNAKQVMDPNDPTKPFVGYKDLTPAAKAYADVLKAQLIGLDKEEANGMVQDTSKLQSRRVELNTQLLNVLTGGIGDAGKAGESPPVAGAQKAPDGNWYVTDPKRPGKYMQVTPSTVAPEKAAAKTPQPESRTAIISNRSSSGSASSPLGMAADAATEGVTNAIESVANSSAQAKATVAENQALRKKVTANEPLTQAERQRAISIGWIRQ